MGGQGFVRQRPAATLLLILGDLLLLGGIVWVGYVILGSMVVVPHGHGNYLVITGIAQLTVREGGDAPRSGPQAAATPDLPMIEASTSPQATASPGKLAAAGPSPVTATPGSQSGADSASQPSPAPAAAVRIRIPAIGVDRSIIEVPLAYSARTKSWERNYDKLLGRPGKDLVGHWGGSALPGQPGNTILVGHNYGYGYNAVFQGLPRLRTGQQVLVVTAAGETYTYRVTEVKSIRWSKKNEQELMLHLPYLTIEGPERLTLVTCGGATWAPFPDRVYVVAEPVR